MSNPIDTAAKGLAQSQSQLANSAKRLVQSAAPQTRMPFDAQPDAPGAKDFAKPKQQDEARRPGASASPRRYAGASVQGQGAYIPSMAEETLQMRAAANAYKANARLIEAADDILKMTQQAVARSEKDGQKADG